jgi:hypothetical protein
MTSLELENMIGKYNMNDDEIKLLKDLYESSIINTNYNLIVDDTIEEYQDISNQIVAYVNSNNLLDLKNILKISFDPFRTSGWVDVPDYLYSEVELLHHQNLHDRNRFNTMAYIIDDIPSDPESD